MIASEPPRLFFLHIEKTAGTSFRQILHGLYKEDEICPAYHQAQLLNMDARELSGYRLYAGHYRYDVLRHLLRDVPPLLVFLREPLARTLSHLRYLQRDKRDNQLLRRFTDINTPTLTDLWSSPAIRELMSNFQTKKLALAFDPGDPSVPRHLFDERIRYTPELLATAKQRLDESRFIGFTDGFDDSLRMFCKEFNLEYPAQAPRLNQAPREFDAPHEGFISELNAALRMDIELYEYARQLNARRLA